MSLLAKRITNEDYAAVLCGFFLWFVYLYPVWQTGAFNYPLDWPTVVHDEGVSLSTYGKWFWKTPHNFLTDAFSGDFKVFYNYLSYYILHLLANITNIPPMVLDSVYIGPLNGFLYIIINYVMLNKVFNNKKIALISSILIAFMWHSRITDFILSEYGAQDFQLHVPFLTLMTSNASLSAILFVPTLCFMYLAYTTDTIKYKIWFGFLLGIMLQSHTLTFINVLFINIVYLFFSNYIQIYEKLTVAYKKKILIITAFIIVVLVTVIAFNFKNCNEFLISPIIFALLVPLFFIAALVIDKKKSFYLISYPISLAVSAHYLLAISEMASFGEKTTPACISCRYFTLPEILILYLPHFIAALLGIIFLASNKFKNKQLLVWAVAGILATFMLSYNNFLGWGNHPYRFAISLLVPLMIASAVGIYYGYIQGGKLRLISVLLTIWFATTMALNVNDVFHDRRLWDNPITGTKPMYDFLKQVKSETKDDRYILSAPEFDYPTGTIQTALLLNYTDARGYLPDSRYLLHNEKYMNRLKIFCFFFPSYPHKDLNTELNACKNEDGLIHQDDDNFLKIKEPQLKNSILQIYGIEHIVSLGEHFTPILAQYIQRYKWDIKSSSSHGFIVQPSPLALAGVATFEKGEYTPAGFMVTFTVNKSGNNVLLLAGNHLQQNVYEVLIDDQPQSLLVKTDSLLIAAKDLSVGKHSLTITSAYPGSSDYKTKNDFIYFLNVIHQNDFEKYISIQKRNDASSL